MTATESNSTDMTGLLAYMSTQPFVVPQPGMYVSFEAEESVIDPSFGNSNFCNMTNATVEIVNASNNTVLAEAHAMPSLCSLNWWQHQASSPATYTYDLSAYTGMNVYIRMNIQESQPVPFTSYATTYSSDGDLGWSPYNNNEQNGTLNPVAQANKSRFGKEVSPAGTENMTTLEQNYPNPFVSSTSIAVNNLNGATTLKVYDMLGRQVADLTGNLPQNVSRAEVNFDAANLPSGIYMYRLETATGLVQVKQMNLQK